MSRIRPLLADDWQLYRSLRLRALRDSPDAFGSTFVAERQRTDADWQARAHQAAARASDAAWFALTGMGQASAHSVDHVHHESAANELHANPDGSQACGLVWCQRAADQAGLALLFQMWVAPEARACGAGAALLNAAIDWAQAGGATHMRLGATVAQGQHSAAMGLYLSRGFRAQGLPMPLRELSPLRVQTLVLNLT